MSLYYKRINKISLNMRTVEESFAQTKQSTRKDETLIEKFNRKIRLSKFNRNSYRKVQLENNQLIYPKVRRHGWNQILTASVHSKNRVINDFHCRNPSSDCPICTTLDVTNKYLPTKRENSCPRQLLTKKTTNANCSSPRSRSSEPPKYFFSKFSSSKVYKDHNNIIKLRINRNN